MFSKITSAYEKTEICDKILRALPNWFGDEYSLADYVAGVGDKPFYCAYDGASPVGFVSILPHNPHTAEIYVMGILETHHRMGIGKKLVEICQDYCRTHGHEFLTVKTLAATHPDPYYAKTRKFYESMGFKPIEIFPTLWGEANPCLFMAQHKSGWY